MADIKKIATRESYGNALAELGREHADVVVLDADLAGATKTSTFKKEFPDRHFDCGIAEGNMMAVAAGIASMGMVPFASTFAMFAAGRAFEQVRNSIGYPHLNVKIGATHGGISVGEDGASHQCCEDFALMRSIPGMTVICPADDVEARAAVKAAYEFEGPVYLRFGRSGVPVFHDEDFKFEIGKGEVLQNGNDVAITPFHAMSAGLTTSYYNVWGKGIGTTVPYLAGGRKSYGDYLDKDFKQVFTISSDVSTFTDADNRFLSITITVFASAAAKLPVPIPSAIII